MTIATPEGVDIDLTLAGIGSRFIASLIDTLIKLVVYIGFFIFLFGGTSLLGGRDLSSLGAAAFWVVSFLVWFAYDVFFETLSSGRTPGKRLTGLRVVRIGGRPVGFVASSIRNMVRIVDILPGFYLVGMISAVATRLNQRLGDLAAGTVVVREKRVAVESAEDPRSVPTPVLPSLESWDVAAVTAEELTTIRRFLERRGELAPHARDHLARELAGRLQGKVVGAPPMAPEAFLEYVSAAKARRA